MSEHEHFHRRWVLSAAVVALVAGLSVGRLAASARQSGAPAAAPASPIEPVKPAGGASISDGKRYKIPVSATQPSKGASPALVTLIQWSDLRCARCAAVEPVIGELMGAYAGQLRVVWRNVLTGPRPDAIPAAEFAAIANEQAGKFWDVHALMVKDERMLTSSDLDGYASEIGLDVAAARDALKDHRYGTRVTGDRVFAKKFGVTPGPAYFVNGRRLLPPYTRERFAALIDEEIAQAKPLLAQGVPPERIYEELTASGLWGAP